MDQIHGRIAVNLDWVLPEPLRKNPFLEVTLDLDRFAPLIPLIPTPEGWDIGAFTIEMVKANPELGKELLPALRQLPDDCWVKDRIFALCGEEQDLESLILMINSGFDHTAGYAAIEMLQRLGNSPLRELFNGALENSLGEESLSREVEGVDPEFQQIAGERVAWDRWPLLEAAWNARLLAAPALMRLAASPTLPYGIREEALCLLWKREGSLEGYESELASILNKMEVPNANRRPKLYQLWLALIDELPEYSVSEAVVARLEQAAAGPPGPFQRLFRWLFRA